MKKEYKIFGYFLLAIAAIFVVVFVINAFSSRGGLGVSPGYGPKVLSKQSVVEYGEAMPALYASQDEDFYDDGTFESESAVDMDERMIIKTSELSVVVEDVASSVKSITKFATENNGFVVSSDISKYNQIPSATVVIRIPSEVFDSGVEEIKKIGDVKSQFIKGDDVTEEYVDLDAQIKNLKATEEQFLAIMKKAVKIEDILAVQRELSNVRSNIERIEGRMKYLRESVKLSTITIHLSSDPASLPVVDQEDKWKPLATIKDAVRGLFDSLKVFADFVIWFVVYIPVFVIYAALFYLLYRFGFWVFYKIKK